MILKIVRSGNTHLSSLSKPIQKVDKKVLSIIKDLTETLSVQKDPEGIGLAAPQVGKNLRIFVMLEKGKIRPIINPEIISLGKKPHQSKSKKTKKSKSREILEGCLSLPNYYCPLKRAEKIKIKYLDIQGREQIEEFSGLPAQIVQHEIDHLNGIMFINRLLEQKKPLYKLTGNEWEEVELI